MKTIDNKFHEKISQNQSYHKYYTKINVFENPLQSILKWENYSAIFIKQYKVCRLWLASFHALFARYTFAEQRRSVLTPEGRQSEARLWPVKIASWWSGYAQLLKLQVAWEQFYQNWAWSGHHYAIFVGQKCL